LFDYGFNDIPGSTFQGGRNLSPAGTFNALNYMVLGHTGDWIIIEFPTHLVILRKFVFKESVTLNSI
jgi:hypothetical protein